jgi:hypothetical protein
MLSTMTADELHALMDPKVLNMIEAHRNDNPSTFAMQFHGRRDLPVRAMAEQIACIQKAEKKLPSLSGYPLLYTRLALEQASGERAAAYKAELLSGKRMIDLSGGLGIDTIFLSRSFEQIVYCERDPLLSEVVRANLSSLGITNVEVITGDGPAILETFPDDFFDWIYVDPARREHGRRSAGLEASSPDVVKLHDALLKKAPRACIKASPLLEFSGLQEKLPALAMVAVVSVERECKEVLLMLQSEREPGRALTLRAVLLGEKSYTIEAAEGDAPVRAVASLPEEYFYVPDPAIIKAKLTASLASLLGFRFVNASVDYLTSARFEENFPGRVFRVSDVAAYKPKTFGGFLESRTISAASIQRRDFPLSPDEIRKKYRLGESDEVYLFFTKNGSGELVCISCRRL